MAELHYHRDRRRANRAFIKGIRTETFCATCGAQPIDWHHPEHVQFPQRRLGNMESCSRTTILAEIAKCTALCRRCHMIEDGRLWGLISATKAKLTHCIAGHPFDESNTRIVGQRAYRVCRVCNREAARRYRARIQISGNR